MNNNYYVFLSRRNNKTWLQEQLIKELEKQGNTIIYLKTNLERGLRAKINMYDDAPLLNEEWQEQIN